MSVSVRIINKLPRRNREVKRKYENNAQRYVDSISQFFKNEVQRSFTFAKTGKTYKKTKAKKNHIASAVGEAPAVDTSDLTKSMDLRKLSRFVAKVSANVDYAETLEDMDRPFMSKTSHAYRTTVNMAKKMINLLKVRV